MSKDIEFEGQVHSFPDDFTDDDIAKALGGGQPATPAPRGPLAPVNDILQGFRGSVGKIMAPSIPGGTPAWAKEALNPIPGSAMELGALAGTGVGGGLAARAGLRPGMAALSRVTGGAVGGAGGAVGAEPTLESAAKGAAVGGGGAALGETGSALVGKLLRSAPNNPIAGGKRNIAAQDARAYAGEMGRQSPPLAGARTVQDLQGLAQGGGRQALGDAKEGIIRQIEGLTGNGPLSVPSLDPHLNFTLREANDRLSEIGARAFSRNPLDRTFQGVDQRRLYGQITNELDAALGAAHPDAPGLFQRAQADYRRGMSLLRPLQQQNAYRLAPNDVQFNTPAIQRSLQTPKNAASMRNKLGDQDYEALLNTMTRGAGQGQDVLASGQGGVLDALQQTIGRGTNSGAMGMLGVPLRTALPNVGSQYTGRAPYTLPPMLQQALDVILQRQAGQVSP